MKKFFKSIFGRFSIIALAVILQVTLFIGAMFYLENIYFIIKVVFIIIAILVLFSLTVRQMPLEAKLTWTAIVIALPLFGSICYLMFSRNVIPLYQKKIYQRQKDKIDSFHKLGEDYQKQLDENVEPIYQGQLNYLYNIVGNKAFFHTKCKFYPNGESFFADYLNTLKSAEHFILMEYFIVAKGEIFDQILQILKEKIAQGVEIYLLYDDVGSIKYLKSNFARKMTKLGIKCYKFNRFIPIASSIHNNRDHRKITIVDGKVAYTGGINIADEYANITHPYGYWKDTGVQIQGEAVDEFTVMFFSSLELIIKKDINFEPYLKHYEDFSVNGVVVPYGDGPRPLYDAYIAENVYLNMINTAQKSIYITTPYLICDELIKNALCNAALRGIDVRIYTPHIPDKKAIFMITRSNYRLLLKNKVKIYEYEEGFLHAKQFLVDDKIGIVGTINLDYRSLVHHFENAVWFNTPGAIKQLSADFEYLANHSIDMKDFSQNPLAYFICKVLEIFQPLL
jgi:cardiolipin synthase